MKSLAQIYNKTDIIYNPFHQFIHNATMETDRCSLLILSLKPYCDNVLNTALSANASDIILNGYVPQKLYRLILTMFIFKTLKIRGIAAKTEYPSVVRTTFLSEACKSVKELLPYLRIYEASLSLIFIKL